MLVEIDLHPRNEKFYKIKEGYLLNLEIVGIVAVIG